MSNETGSASDNTETTVESNNTDFGAIKGQLDTLSAELARVVEFNNRAISEKKQAQEQARQASEEVAKKKGDWEQIIKSREDEKKQWEDKYTSLYGSLSKERVENTATKIAGALAEGSNMELLSEQVAKRLKYTDDGIKVLDKNGQVSFMSLDELKNDVARDARYASLITHTKANGGGATGSHTTSGAQGTKITRSELAKMSPLAQGEFMKHVGASRGGNEIID